MAIASIIPSVGEIRVVETTGVDMQRLDDGLLQSPGGTYVRVGTVTAIYTPMRCGPRRGPNFSSLTGAISSHLEAKRHQLLTRRQWLAFHWVELQ